MKILSYPTPRTLVNNKSSRTIVRYHNAQLSCPNNILSTMHIMKNPTSENYSIYKMKSIAGFEGPAIIPKYIISLLDILLTLIHDRDLKLIVSDCEPSLLHIE